MRISDWSSDVCSSDLIEPLDLPQPILAFVVWARARNRHRKIAEIGLQPLGPDVIAGRGRNRQRVAACASPAVAADFAKRFRRFAVQGDGGVVPRAIAPS